MNKMRLNGETNINDDYMVRGLSSYNKIISKVSIKDKMTALIGLIVQNYKNTYVLPTT